MPTSRQYILVVLSNKETVVECYKSHRREPIRKSSCKQLRYLMKAHGFTFARMAWTIISPVDGHVESSKGIKKVCSRPGNLCSLDIPPMTIVFVDSFTEACLYGESNGGTHIDESLVCPVSHNLKDQPCSREGCTTIGRVKLCSQCKTTAYCSLACQRVHWKCGGHKLACIERQKAQEAPAVESASWYCNVCEKLFPVGAYPGKAETSLRTCQSCCEGESLEGATFALHISKTLEC